MVTKTLRILLELLLIGLLIYFFETKSISLIVMLVVIIIWIELYLSKGITGHLSKKRVNSCPCCKYSLSSLDLLKYSLKNILKKEEYFYCPQCSRIISSLKYYKKKVFILSTFTFGIIEVFLITFSYYVMAIITVLLWFISYIYGLTLVKLQCYEDEEDANKNDIAKHELEQEKNLNVLLGILIFLFFIFALILKVFVL